jgi:hypothetical protein
MPIGRTEPSAVTLSFEKFWQWLQGHSNCILRAGTPEVLLFDHEDYHWHMASEDESVLVVQLVRGKELVGEMVVLSNEISYVQCESGEGEEYVFDCVVETEAAREVAYHFVMAHAYDETDQPPTSPTGRRGGWTH